MPCVPSVPYVPWQCLALAALNRLAALCAQPSWPGLTERELFFGCGVDWHTMTPLKTLKRRRKQTATHNNKVEVMPMDPSTLNNESTKSTNSPGASSPSRWLIPTYETR